MVDGVPKRSIRHDAAIPVPLAVDLDRGKRRRQRTTRQHMFWADSSLRIIEIDWVTGAHVDCANAKAHFASSDAVEVNEPSEGLPQRIDVVYAQGTRRAVGHKRRWRHSWNKEARYTDDGTQCGAGMNEALVQCADEWRRHQGDARRHTVPERTHALDALLWRITRNQGGVDRTHRHSRDPVRQIACLRHPLEHACLVCAECPATLQYQDDVIVLGFGAKHDLLLPGHNRAGPQPPRCASDRKYLQPRIVGERYLAPV